MKVNTENPLPPEETTVSNNQVLGLMLSPKYGVVHKPLVSSFCSVLRQPGISRKVLAKSIRNSTGHLCVFSIVM